jgi:predicted nucleic acid-binding protein
LIVVDTNVIAYLWLPNERRADARALLAIHNRWFAPLLWRFEFRNILAGYLRRRELSLEQARAAYDGAAEMLRGGERMPAAKAVLELAAASDLSAYDCEFVAVADALGIPLVTADRKILRTFPRIACDLGRLLY